MVSAWPEPPNAMSAEKSAGVRDGVEALAFGITETRTHPGQNRCPERIAPGHPFQRRLRSRTSGQLERVSISRAEHLHAAFVSPNGQSKGG